jgi:predicted Rossmann-fold nucleotide-binding protein
MAKVPIVLLDKSYWSPLVEWIEHRAIPYQLIEPEDPKIIQITDSVEEAISIIHEGCKHRLRSPAYNGMDKP